MSIAKKLPYIIFVGVVLIAFVSVIFLIRFLHKGTDSKKVVAQQITLITPPPPPPPPPPEKPPEVEPPKMQEEIPQEQPQEQAQEEAPGQDLGVDADGGAGGDSFGLIGRKGGTGLGLGKAGHYEVMVKEKVLESIYSDDELKHQAYTSLITVWIGPNGKVERFAISVEGGNAKTKKLLEGIVGKMTFESGPPIENADKGIKLRINSRI